MNKSNVNALDADTKRNYKDSLFCRLFSDKVRALSLYNAVNGTDYTNADDLEIVTLEDSIFIVMKNDVAVLFNNRITFFEHQSSVNPNMPLRGLFYYARTMDGILTKAGIKEKLYRKTLVKIPAPEYYVLYNGQEEEADKKDFLLSEAFITKVEGYEWTAHMININEGHNSEILEKCGDLLGYSVLVGYVRKYIEAGYNRDAAVVKAVDRCVEEGYLKDYLLKHRAEATYMGFFDWDEELWKETMKEMGREEGREEGAILQLIGMVCRKLSRGKDPMTIANELEEDEKTIQEICEAAKDFVPDYDVDEIYKAYTEKLKTVEA